MTPYEFGKHMGRSPTLEFLKLAGKSYEPGTSVLSEWWNAPKGTGMLSYMDKWYNPWTTNTDPMSRGEAPLMWAGRAAMGTGAAAGTAAAGIAAAPTIAAAAQPVAAGAGRVLANRGVQTALNAMTAADLAYNVVPGLFSKEQGGKPVLTETAAKALNHGASGGLAGAGIGALLGLLRSGEHVDVDPETGRTRVTKRKMLPNILLKQ